MSLTNHEYRLGDLVERAASDQGLQLDPSNRPFRSSSERPGPALCPRNGPCRVLLYPGSFNPPHQGHEALLKHVLDNAGTDYPLAAAFIVLTDDEKLANKNRRDEKPFLMSKEKRATLWRGSDIPRDRVWVFDGSESDWKTLRTQLQSNLRRARINVRFTLLIGPDWMSSRAATDPRDWACVEAITSDISRPVDFRYPTTLRQLSKCSMWEPCEVSHGGPTGDFAMDSGRDKTLTLGGIRAGVSWKCSTLRKPFRHYRFVPAPLQRQARIEPPSSTEIRRTIALRQDKLCETDVRMALSPWLLLRYAIEGGPYSVPVVVAKFEDHEVRKAKAHEMATW